jgi:hypothetical protein
MPAGIYEIPSPYFVGRPVLDIHHVQSADVLTLVSPELRASRASPAVARPTWTAHDDHVRREHRADRAPTVTATWEQGYSITNRSRYCGTGHDRDPASSERLTSRWRTRSASAASAVMCELSTTSTTPSTLDGCILIQLREYDTGAEHQLHRHVHEADGNWSCVTALVL